MAVIKVDFTEVVIIQRGVERDNLEKEKLSNPRFDYEWAADMRWTVSNKLCCHVS